jgi:hypothetical protein
VSFEICRGTPQYTGRYVCYLPGVEVPTVVRLFIAETGWCDNLHEKISGPVAGWIGPLPIMPDNSVEALTKPETYDL